MLHRDRNRQDFKIKFFQSLEAGGESLLLVVPGSNLCQGHRPLSQSLLPSCFITSFSRMADDAGAAEPAVVATQIDLSAPLAPHKLFSSAETEFAPTAKCSNCFTKGIHWSPDGTCLLSCGDDNALRVFELPAEAQKAAWLTEPLTNSPSIEAALTAHEGETVYSYGWYPRMDSSQPDSCVFASSCRDHPVHLWDAFTGELRSTYRAYNHVDEIFAAYSLGFDPAGDRLYAGYKAELRCFEISRPGRNYTQVKLGNKKNGGQRGMVSCMAFNPDFSGLLATGSYDNSICLLSTHDRKAEVLSVFEGHSAGVAQLQFSADGRYLYSAARKDDKILCWDIRGSGQLLCTMERPGNSNQHIQFDLERSTGRVISAGLDGKVRAFESASAGGAALGEFTAHEDVCNGLSIHPWLPLLATSSGQRIVLPPAYKRKRQCSSSEEEPQESKGTGVSSNQVAGWRLPWGQLTSEPSATQ